MVDRQEDQQAANVARGRRRLGQLLDADPDQQDQLEAMQFAQRVADDVRFPQGGSVPEYLKNPRAATDSEVEALDAAMEGDPQRMAFHDALSYLTGMDPMVGPSEMPRERPGGWMPPSDEDWGARTTLPPSPRTPFDPTYADMPRMPQIVPSRSPWEPRRRR